MADEAKYEKCPYCGETGYFLAHWNCGTGYLARGRRGTTCYENELETVKAQRDKLLRAAKEIRRELDGVCPGNIGWDAFQKFIDAIEAESEVKP
jgi:hypothetical protein